MSNSTIVEIDKILKSIMRHGDSPIIQKILRESLDNDNESKGLVPLLDTEDQTTRTNTTSPTFGKEDEIV